MTHSPLVGREAPLDSLAARVQDQQVGPVRVMILPTPVRSVVSWRGSFLAFPDFARGDELVQSMTVGMLDKGTRRRDRFAIADVLETRGAQLHFSSDEMEIGFQGRALREDLPEVLRVLAEQLREPLFDADEFRKVKAQMASGLQRTLHDTGTQAASALTRRLYAPGHPNYTVETRENLRQLEALTVEDVRRYHEHHFGAREALLVFVGDVDPDVVRRVIEETLGDWGDHPAPPAFATAATPHPPGRIALHIPEKANVDVRLGQALPVRRQDPDYIPLYVANYILGGNFSARLMTVVRDEMGLTYGIGSSLNGISTDYDGYWQVSVTLSKENVDRGLEATLAEVSRFVEGGVAEGELADKKTTITGSFKVGLATTRGLGAALHVNARRGFGAQYLDRFPAEVEEVTLGEVNEVIRRRLDPEALQTALAGAIQDGSAPR